MKKYSAPTIEAIYLFGSDIATDIIIASGPQSGDNDTPLLGMIPDQNNNNGNY